MHAYLLISQNADAAYAGGRAKSQIDKLAKKLGAEIMEFPIAKIEDTRNLNKLIRLSFDKPTLIVCQNIHEATEEALNAFLKNLEEPQDNIFFALTAPSTQKLLPTITSRCEVTKLKVENTTPKDAKEMEKFMQIGVGEKLNYVAKIKDRQKAIDFAESLVFFLHSRLHKNELSEALPSQDKMIKYSSKIKNLEAACQTLSRLKRNGNVNLQLVSLVTQL
jgi:hypothetical protein